MPEVSKKTPIVCCVMLADGRDAMVRRAIQSFFGQTYHNSWLLIYDTGKTPQSDTDYAGVTHFIADKLPTIGQLRNAANDLVKNDCDIICQWDSDDLSHPRRIEEQVARLTDREVTGYNQMLFWKLTKSVDATLPANHQFGSAWLYTGAPRYMLGTSLCYWRETWQRKPFPHTSIGEDLHWQDGLRGVSGSSIPLHGDREPRMIASIHGRNTCGKIEADKPEWRRSPEWDEHVRARMAL